MIDEWMIEIRIPEDECPYSDYISHHSSINCMKTNKLCSYEICPYKLPATEGEEN